MEAEKSGKINYHIDDRDEGSMYDNHVTGIYKQEKYSTLFNHLPAECSTLLDNFVNADKENRLNWWLS